MIRAAHTLERVAHRTPILTSRTLDAQLGVRVFFKCENFQRMGAFKFRGAYTAVRHYLDCDRDLNGADIGGRGDDKNDDDDNIDDDAAKNDDDINDNQADDDRNRLRILTYSSGNHAQAIALAATSLLGVPSTIIMPRDAPPLKVEATRSYGGDVVFYDRYKEERDAVAERIKRDLSSSSSSSSLSPQPPQQQPKVVFIPPYDHKYVIAGQGTVGKEFLEDLPPATPLDYLFVCVGGGGLLSGISLAARALSPRTKLVGVEPLAGNDAQRSLATGSIVKIPTPRTIADGAQTQHLGDLTFRILTDQRVERIVTVTDGELVDEMRFFGERMKMIVEPTGCLALAGLRKLVRLGEVEKGSCCGVVVSGGNVDLERYCALISGGVPDEGVEP